jgi:UDP-sulfoquinovose synthase
MKVLVLGGDGYLGWPQALYLSARGHDVHVVDNFLRRRFDLDHGLNSLAPIAPLHRRLARWHAQSGLTIGAHTADITDHALLRAIFTQVRPDVVVHFGEQRSAPYSMIDRDHAVHTQVNNVVGTLNVLYCIAELVPDCHLVKLGTMGEYGTPNIDIEEGFLEIHHNGRVDTLPFPKQPGSFYHLSKVHDSHNIMFACRVWGIRATDLNQGVVYGAETEQTALHAELATRLDYDHVYGTALNRFCVQAALGRDITVYGQGGQTRGYIDIRDTVRCIELAMEAPPDPREYRVFNQITEQFTLDQIAERVATVAVGKGLQTTISKLPNPRVEVEQHHYRVTHTKLEELGLKPHLLGDDTIAGLLDLVARNRDCVDATVLQPRIDWRRLHNTVREPA